MGTFYFASFSESDLSKNDNELLGKKELRLPFIQNEKN